MNFPLWFSNLLFWSAQVAVLTLVAGVLVRLLRIRRPEALLVQWRALIVISLLLPVLQPWHWQTVLAEPAAAPPVPFPHAAPAAMAPASAHWQFPSAAIIAEIVGIAILFGIVVRLTFFVLGLLKLRQLRNGSSAISAGAELTGVFEKARLLIGARAECRVSAQVESPVTFGFIAPVILLPERFSQLDPESQAAVLCHELLHVRRRDWLHHLAEEILRVWFWFHPGILWLVSRVRLSREQVVDEQVIKLTQARKSYVQALLEFTDRSAVAAVPAPLFLGERQLVERVSLMLKEVRMSRTRLIASLSAIACALALAGIFAVSVFPLKAGPRPQTAPQAAPSAPAETLASRPVVSANTIWIGRVTRGVMAVQVSGGGTLIPANSSGRLVAEVLIGGDVQSEVHLSQSALVRTNRGIIEGHVENLGLADSNGNPWFDIALDSPLPPGIGANTTVAAFITVAEIKDAVYIQHPAGQDSADVAMALFKVVDNGKQGVRVEVGFGRSNMNDVQVVSGLSAGDSVILSDMFPYNRFARIQIAR
jgi:beta-lactamase regulating signal transducer with metallopeptidase domain